MNCKDGGNHEHETSGAMDRRDFIKLSAGVGAVAMTALEAGQTLAQGGAEKPRSIDLHTHWTPPTYSKAIAQLKMPPNAALGSSAPPNPDSPSVNLEKR